MARDELPRDLGGSEDGLFARDRRDRQPGLLRPRGRRLRELPAHRCPLERAGATGAQHKPHPGSTFCVLVAGRCGSPALTHRQPLGGGLDHASPHPARFRRSTMIKHIVMWNIAGDTKEDRRKAAELLRSRFEGLRGEVPGLLHLEVGLDHSSVDYACDVVLYTEFESQAALDAYATHPAHLRVKGELGQMRIARFQVDYLVTADAL